MAEAQAGDFIEAPTDGPGADHIRSVFVTYGQTQ